MSCEDPLCACQRISAGDGSPVEAEPITDAAFDKLSVAEKAINAALYEIREAQRLDPGVLEAYGGKGYPRHLSLAVTKLEEGILWMGGTLQGGL